MLHEPHGAPRACAVGVVLIAANQAVNRLADDAADNPGNCVDQIVVSIGRVFDTDPAAACAAQLEAGKLIDQLRVVEQIDSLEFTKGSKSRYRSLFGFGAAS